MMPLFDIGMGPLEHGLSEGFQHLIGSAELIGVAALVFFLIVAVFFGLDLGVSLLILIPLVTILTVNGFFPVWLFVLIMIGVALIIYLALKSFFER
jgi:cell division protein FtsW (lipid II flippase)